MAQTLQSVRLLLKEGAGGLQFDRPGATYELRPWTKSAGASVVEEEGVIAE